MPNGCPLFDVGSYGLQPTVRCQLWPHAWGTVCSRLLPSHRPCLISKEIWKQNFFCAAFLTLNCIVVLLPLMLRVLYSYDLYHDLEVFRTICLVNDSRIYITLHFRQDLCLLKSHLTCGWVISPFQAALCVTWDHLVFPVTVTGHTLAGHQICLVSYVGYETGSVAAQGSETRAFPWAPTGVWRSLKASTEYIYMFGPPMEINRFEKLEKLNIIWLISFCFMEWLG